MIKMDQKRLQKIFSEVPKTYEVVNHILTLGLDRAWRKKAARLAVQSGGQRLLDICSGTGDMAVLLRRLSRPQTMVVSQDFCAPMLRKAISKPGADKISFCVSDSRRHSFKDNAFDVATISFATRNINAGRDALAQYFREFYRILKPGGRFINLETSQPPNRIFRRLFHLYVRMAVMPIGYAISGSNAAYRYLSGTIPIFYEAEELSYILSEAGFKNVSFSHLTFGACAIHVAVK